MKIETFGNKNVVTIKNMQLYFGKVMSEILLHALIAKCDNFIVAFDRKSVYISYDKLYYVYFEITGSMLGE